ncbi:pyridoxal phosphate-dependent aminotransferase [Deinococcus arcticus]|uniref:Aspartate aminotransferase n=1 Tax=Deinococcus arcticus TaxID=2136176 RepID=A0A2T3WA21_9DEIO|nr:pyridoxal phosphate-dependent aminotransferase [Deinococcus arcticus]PTA68746.1 aspartate aminotransferase [Deinococcus arcticus]
MGTGTRPARLRHIQGIGVDRMGSLADAHPERDFLRLENLDTDIPPDPQAVARTQASAERDADNSYLPFVGQTRLREVVATHAARLSGVPYTADNVIISAGGLSGLLNVLLALIEVGDEVIVTDPTYAGLINRVHLVGGIPRFVPFIFQPGGEWTLDQDALRASITPRTRALLLMSPAMPSGAVLTQSDWDVVAELCTARDLLLIVDSAMERLVFDGRAVLAPAGWPGMAGRTISVGSAAKELRLIGWRVGWIVAPGALIPDLVAVSLANVVVPVGLAQDAARVALERSWETLPAYVAELQQRRDATLQALQGLPVGRPGGGWSLLLRTSDFGLTGEALSQRLLDANVCATAMTGWGQTHGAQYLRFVFANEPVGRLSLLRERLMAALP